MSKKAMFLSLAACLFLIMLTSMTFASTITFEGAEGDAGNYGPYQSGVGGEFTVSPSDANTLGVALNLYSSNTKNYSISTTYPTTFQTFCVEDNEYISSGIAYDAVLSNAAINGGAGGLHPDPLSKGAAWLYYQFATGTLDSYNYIDNPATTSINERKVSAALLQNAIWYLEEEGGANNSYVTLASNQFGNLTDAMKDNVGVGASPVKVINLTYNGSVAQDQLAVVTPIPSALLLLGPGLIGLVGIRRRMAR
jgi:hypothetical protein